MNTLKGINTRRIGMIGLAALGLVAAAPVQAAHGFMDGAFMVAKRERNDAVRQDQRDAPRDDRRDARRDAEREERGYGYGYERRQQQQPQQEEDDRPRGRRR